MTTRSSPVLVDQSPVRYEHSPASSYPRLQYSPVQGPQRPQPVHTTYIRRPSETQRTESTRLQSSISSAESGSSAMTIAKPYPDLYPYWQASTLEQGLMHEKGIEGWQSPRQSQLAKSPHHDMSEDNSTVLRYIQEQQKIVREEEEENEHAVWILFWLSCLDPIHSLVSALYTILVVFILAMASPLRICRKQSSLGDQVIRILAPLFRNHLDMMYAPSVHDAFSFQFKACRLVAVHLSAPLLSFGVMVASWVTVAFWLFSRIMGNPDGVERRDDGKDTVIQVRDWWEKYLLNAIER